MGSLFVKNIPIDGNACRTSGNCEYFCDHNVCIVSRKMNIDSFVNMVLEKTQNVLYKEVKGKNGAMRSVMTRREFTEMLKLGEYMKENAKHSIVCLFLCAIKNLRKGVRNFTRKRTEPQRFKELTLVFTGIFHLYAIEYGITDMDIHTSHELMYNNFENENFESLEIVIAIAKRGFFTRIFLDRI